MLRRSLLKGALGAALIGATGCVTKPASARVVIVGGGFGGASAARTLKRLDPSLAVTLIEPKAQYVSCPFSNLVLAGERSITQQTFSYQSIAAEGISVIRDRAVGIDPISRRVDLASGDEVGFDRMILAPGISLKYEALDGYSSEAASVMPHAWLAGEQTMLLRKQLEAMDDGGVVAISVPANPYRCPPGPYERASLIAGYLKQFKPRSKVFLLDAKDQFSKQGLFLRAWKEKFGELIEWQGLSDGASVVRVDAATNTLVTDFDAVSVDVANVIPPQQAGQIAISSGIADRTGWCPVDALTFESSLAPNVHVIGDAAILNAMPKSAFAANAQAKLCATQIVRDLRGDPPIDVTLANTCYSLLSEDYDISIAGVYQADAKRWRSVPGSGGVSDLNAGSDVRSLEAQYAKDWFRAITQEAFL